jgi:hypothetical protein
MGTGPEREASRPLVLRHAYQSETRRYTPRCPERTLLYRIVSENLETLLQTAREQSESGLGLPKYVEKEFREYLRCGIACHGFTRLVCEACGRTLFLSFSCKRRGCCSSCSARRMCNTAAVVVDRVLLEVPVRQWVLSTPFEIRLLLARNAEAFGELTRIFMEEVLGQYRRRAAKLGIANCEGGALVFQHRFGGSLNLNTHLHAVVVDGVFERTSAQDGTERARFHPLPPPQPVELTSVAYDVYRKFEVWLKNKELMRLADADETYANEDALATCLRGSLGIGQVVELDEAGDVRCSREQADEQRFTQRKSPQTGEFGGFSIHAGVTVHAADNDGRERLIRYCARPALSMERLSETSDGLIAYRLRHAQKGKATHRVMRPIDLLARIAAIIPPPRHPLLRYFGVFGPHSSWRKLCVPAVVDPKQTDPTTSTSHSPDSAPTRPDADKVKVSPKRRSAANGSGSAVVNATPQLSDPSGQDASPKLAASMTLNSWRIDWATLLKRTYDFDVLRCPCGGRLKAVELVTDAARAKEVLEQLGRSTKPPPIARARSPDWD